MAPVAGTPPRVQVTVVAGPPVEMQVKVNTSGSVVRLEFKLNLMGPLITGMPVKEIYYMSIIIIV